MLKSITHLTNYNFFRTQELESQTDDNSSPANADKTPGSNKRSADQEADGSMSSNGKKLAMEIKQEKNE